MHILILRTLKIISRILFACLSVLFASGLLAQDAYQVIQPVEAVMKAKQYKDGSNEKQIFASLAVNNIKNIHQVSIYIKGDLLVSVKRDKEGHLFSYVKMLHPVISGEVYFRNFLIDTILFPKAFEGYLFIYKRHELISKIPVEMLLTGGVLDLESIEYKFSGFDQITAEIQISRFFLNDSQLQEYMDLANAVNTYYSYNEALRLLLERLDKDRLNRGMSSASTFIAWHEINRIKSYLNEHMLKETLNLEEKDPANLLEKEEKLLRLERRAATLFIKELQKGKRGKLSDREIYCRAYVDLSVKYIELAKNYPPTMSAAFNELVHIFPIEQDLNRMSNAASFYDLFRITGVPPTTQRIYNYFVDEAKSQLDEERYLNALALIRNAKEIECFFESIVSSREEEEVYVNSLDGLLSSFLQVSVMAYKARNFKMAKRYYHNAQQIYEEHVALLGSEEKIKYTFRNFVEKQVELAGLLLDDDSYEEAITLLDDAKSIVDQHSFTQDHLNFSSNYKRGYTGLYETLVDSVAYYLEQEKKENGLSALLYSAEFEQEHSEYLERDERITSYAFILYDKFYQQGLSKLNGKYPEQAIKYLLEAKKINELFLQQRNTGIDSLVSVAAVPLIEERIRKAEFEVWANRLENAKILKQEALSLQSKYQLMENAEICQAISSLDQKIEQRACVALQYKTDNICRIVRNRIAAGKINEAEQKLSDMISLLNEYSWCAVDTTELSGLREAYRDLFDYVNRWNALTEDMSTVSFNEFLSRYTSLSNDYREYKLERYVQNPPPLNVMISNRSNVKLIEEAVKYYTENRDYMQAFEFLELFRKKGADEKTTKSYQKIIGAGLCAGRTDKKTYISNLTHDNAYYKTLRSSCLKN